MTKAITCIHGITPKWHCQECLKVESKAQILARANIPLGSKCEECGSTENLERHHPDYSKPLETQTLCRACHLKKRKTVQRKRT